MVGLRKLTRVEGALVFAGNQKVTSLASLEVNDPIEYVGGDIVFLLNTLAPVNANFWQSVSQTLQYLVAIQQRYVCLFSQLLQSDKAFTNFMNGQI